jgi:hypothetical protein
MGSSWVAAQLVASQEGLSFVSKYVTIHTNTHTHTQTDRQKILYERNILINPDTLNCIGALSYCGLWDRYKALSKLVSGFHFLCNVATHKGCMYGICGFQVCIDLFIIYIIWHQIDLVSCSRRFYRIDFILA